MSQTGFPVKLLITAIRDEGPQVRTFTLAAVDGAPLVYAAGQFLTFSFMLGNKEERRSYSVSSSPAAGDRLCITVKRVENGAFSRRLIDHARPGDELLCTGVAGLFTLPERLLPRQLLFFAAGIGITPVYALLKELAARGYPGTSAVLVYSNKRREDAVFRKELEMLEAGSGGRLKIEWICSNDQRLERARLTRTLMDQLLQTYLVYPEAALTYICGPADYRWLAQLLLEEAGIPPDHIRQEIFITERPLILQEPPDKSPRVVTLHFRGQEYQVPVQYPDTILTAAQKAGIDLPYSCKAGRCSSCAARCTAGKVWMSYNEVLTDQDIRQGLALTCTGYPVGGDITLVL